MNKQAELLQRLAPIKARSSENLQKRVATVYKLMFV